jgi:hypothetical protein
LFDLQAGKDVFEINHPTVTVSVKSIGYAAPRWKKGIDLRTNFKKIPMLSKSKYLAGLQCPLRLWHQCYNPHLASPVSPAKQALFDTGHEVGRLAKVA